MIEEVLAATRITFNFEEMSEGNMNFKVLSNRLKTFNVRESGIIRRVYLEGLSSLKVIMTSTRDNVVGWEKSITKAKQNELSKLEIRNTPLSPMNELNSMVSKIIKLAKK